MARVRVVAVKVAFYASVLASLALLVALAVCLYKGAPRYLSGMAAALSAGHAALALIFKGLQREETPNEGTTDA
jgi:hypothetical protein